MYTESRSRSSASVPVTRDSYVASIMMYEVVCSAPLRPWQKSALAQAALLERDWNASPFQIGTPISFAVLLLLLHAIAWLLFNLLTGFPGSFACAGGFEMDQDCSPKPHGFNVASLHETHLKRTKNLLLKRQRQRRCKLEQTSPQS
jgi:hypothetical protein